MTTNIQIPDRMFFRIGEVAELVGVEPHVLRYWESEFKIRPQRSSSGQRMYRRKEIERFLEIKTLVHDQGFTISGARRALQDGTATAAVTASGGVNAAPARERLAAALGAIREIRDDLVSPSLIDLNKG